MAEGSGAHEIIKSAMRLNGDDQKKKTQKGVARKKSLLFVKQEDREKNLGKEINGWSVA